MQPDATEASNVQNEATAAEASASEAPAVSCDDPAEARSDGSGAATPAPDVADDAELLGEIFQIRREQGGMPPDEH